MKRKFTLVELLITIVVVGVLTIIAVSSVSDVKKDGKETASSADTKSMQTVVDNYNVKKGEYPVEGVKNKYAPSKIDKEKVIPFLHGVLDNKRDWYVDGNGNVFSQKKDVYRSGSLYAWDTKDIDKIMGEIREMRLNTINVPVAIYINALDSNSMNLSQESMEDAIKLIKELHKEGVSVILEPYPIMNDSELNETSWNPSDINSFFWNWKTTVIQPLLEKVAIPQNVFAFNISSNLVNMEYASGYWMDTVDFVKDSGYKGQVTYRTNWWYTADWAEETKQDYLRRLNNPLFGKLDFISISAYFELNEKKEPTIKELEKNLKSTNVYGRGQNVFEEVKKFHEVWGKPIFFGELGSSRKEYAASQPWSDLYDKKDNPIEQSNLFEAYRRVFQDEEWVMGMSVFHIGFESSFTPYYPTKETKRVIANWGAN